MRVHAGGGRLAQDYFLLGVPLCERLVGAERVCQASVTRDHQAAQKQWIVPSAAETNCRVVNVRWRYHDQGNCPLPPQRT